jgi:hypothetical protein
MLLRPVAFAFGCLLCCPAFAWAGMPTPVAVINELPRLRLQNLSFFLAGFLLSSLLIQLLWNTLRRDVPVLPRLSYLRAVGLVGLGGLLFVLVLTMISGARELMTPGAWEPNGVTYRLKPRAAQPEEPDQTSKETRRQQIVRLKEALWQYARAHGGKLPQSRSEPDLQSDVWHLPDGSGLQYVYFGGVLNQFAPVPVAHEPDLHGPPFWVLFSDGEVRQMTSETLNRSLLAEKQ